jgi:hypothetical protein
MNMERAKALVSGSINLWRDIHEYLFRDNCNIGFYWFVLFIIFPDVPVNYLYGYTIQFQILLVLMNLFLFALYFSVLIGLAWYVTLNMKKKIIRKHINFLLEFPNNNKLCQHINFETLSPKYKIMYVQVLMYVHVYVMCMGVCV